MRELAIAWSLRGWIEAFENGHLVVARDKQEWWDQRCIEQRELLGLPAIAAAERGTMSPPEFDAWWEQYRLWMKLPDVYKDSARDAWTSARAVPHNVLAKRGTTPPEGLSEDGIERLIEAGRLISLLSDESGKPCDGFRFREGVAEIRAALTALGRAPYQCDAATQRAPVEQGIAETKLSQQDYNNLVRDAMKWRTQSIRAAAPDHAREGALRCLVAKWREGKVATKLRDDMQLRGSKWIADLCADELEHALANGTEEPL